MAYSEQDIHRVNQAMNVMSTASKVADNFQPDPNVVNDTKSDHPPPEPPAFCVRIFNWIPIQFLTFFGGLCFLVFPILDFMFYTADFIQGYINLYLIAFGILMVLVEMPVSVITRKIQLSLYFWAKFLSRMSGRAWFYILISFLTFSGWNGGRFYIPGIAGIYIIIVALFMLIVSKSSRKKYIRIYTYIAAGEEKEDKLRGIFERKFDELDTDHDGRIGGDAIVKVALEASRELTNAEKHAIQTFLDQSCNGNVSKDDWIKTFLAFNLTKGNIKWL